MLESRGTWTDLIPDVGLKISEVFDQANEEYRPGINQVLQQTSGEGAQKNYSGKTGLGEISRFEEGDNIPGKNRYKTYTTQVEYNNYGGYVQVTKNNIDDRDFEAQLDEMKDLGIATNYSQDKSGIQLFNGGFATTRDVNGYRMTYYGDGVPTFSTVHPTVVPGGSTQSNASSTGITFGHDNLETAKVAMTLQQTDDGLALSLAGKPALVMPINLEREGREETESTLDPENDTNAINVHRGTTDMITCQHLDTVNGGLNTQWFLIVPGRTKFYHEVRQAPDMETDVDILSKNVTFTVDARWANYVKDWRRAWGSKGDGQAYSS
jgi:hypothetical protein